MFTSSFLHMQFISALVLSLASFYLTAEIAFTENNADWPLYGRTHDNQSFSPLKQIDRNNIDKLKLAWRFETGKFGSFQTSPIVIDGVMYLTTNG